MRMRGRSSTDCQRRNRFATLHHLRFCTTRAFAPVLAYNEAMARHLELPPARCYPRVVCRTAGPRETRQFIRDEASKRDDDAWLVISAGALVGDRHPHPYLFPVAAW